MSSNGVSFWDRAEQLANEAEEELQQKLLRRQNLDAEIKDLRDLIRNVKRRPHSSPSKDKTKRQRGSRAVTPEKLLEYAEGCIAMEWEYERMPNSGIAKGVGKSPTTAIPTEQLVEAGILIRAGKGFVNPDKPRGVPVDLYRLDPSADRHIQQLRKQFASATA